MKLKLTDSGLTVREAGGMQKEPSGLRDLPEVLGRDYGIKGPYRGSSFCAG